MRVQISLAKSVELGTRNRLPIIATVPGAHIAQQPPGLQQARHIPALALAAARSGPVGGAQSRQCASDFANWRSPALARNSTLPPLLAWLLRPPVGSSDQC